MARMVPENPADMPSSERLVFNAIRDQTPDSWTAIVRPIWTSAKNRQESSGEADLVLLIPDRGVLVLEVKGGPLSVERGQWFRELPNGRKEPLRKGPDRQAEDAVHHLVRYFKELFVTDRPAVEHAVIFTSGRVKEEDLGLGLPLDIVITRDQIADLESAIERVCEYWKRGGRLTSTLTTKQIERIVDLLMPFGEIRFDLRARTLLTEQQINRETRRQIQLTERQLKVLRRINGEARAVVYGGPGTGKTILALERARRLAADDSDVLLVCATSGIGALLYSAAEREPELKTVVVRTLELLMPEIHDRSGARFKSLKDLKKKWFQTFDALVIDEGQDFSQDDLQSLLTLLRNPGTAPIYVFTDPNQAKLRFHEPKATATNEDWTVSWQHEKHLLCDNCRNTREIVRLAGDLLGKESSDLEEATISGLEPELIECKAESVVKVTMSVIDRLLGTDGYEPGDIGLAVPANAAPAYRKALARRRIRTLPRNEASLLGRPHVRRLDIASPRQFLGLERHIMVVVPPANPQQFEVNLDGIIELRRRIFIGVTRARTHCIIICPPHVKRLIEEPDQERFTAIDELIVNLVSQFERAGASPSLLQLGIALQEEIGRSSYQRFGRQLSVYLAEMPEIRMEPRHAIPTVIHTDTGGTRLGLLSKESDEFFF